MKEMNKGFLTLISHEDQQVNDIPVPTFLTRENVAAAQKIHHGLPIYQETPLVRLQGLAKELGVREIFVKDESKRFGLNAFKGLGGLYALTCVICKELGLDVNAISFETLKSPAYAEKIRDMVFVTATDGNHGKGVSWAAGQLGCEAHVYMPAASSELRAQAIRDVNPRAESRITEMNYDDTVRYASEMAKKNGWHLIQDTSWDGYKEIPSWIIQGYTTMANEACVKLEGMDLTPTHVFVQAGVGAMAGGVVGYIADYFTGKRPQFIIVEPENNACIFQSAHVDDGQPHEAINQEFTIMAGLNCGEPCTITWPILRDFGRWFIKCPDVVAEYGMRRLASPLGKDEAIVSGESGAVTTGLLALMAEQDQYRNLRQLLGLDENSVVLCFSTEGDTDPENYKKIIAKDHLEL